VPRFDFRLTRVPRGCDIDVEVTTRLAGGLLLLWPVVSHGWRRDLPTDASRLRDLLSPAIGR
jgi:hypothetical protein